MVERFIPIDDQLFAILSNGELVVSAINAWEWTTPFPQLKSVQALWHMDV